MRLTIVPGSNVNQVVVSGNLTRDPEHKTFGEDGQLCKLGVAVNRTIGKGDERTEEVSFFDVTVFGGFAGLVARKLRKADSVTVAGELRQDRWTQTVNGEEVNRSSVGIVANQIDSEGFFRSKDEDADLSATSPAAAATATTTEAPAAAAEPQTDDIPF